MARPRILSDDVVSYIAERNDRTALDIFQRVATGRILSEGQKRILADAEEAVKRPKGRPVFVYPSDNLVAQLRYQKNWSQKQTAEALNLAQSTISEYECGRKPISANVEKKIKNLLDT